ncbi:MAG: hypothetical protein ABEJ28_09125 [Salinigranum sp.]
MASLVDIPCPNCGRVEPVEKVGIGTYRCRECGHEFGARDARRDAGVD